MRSRTTLSISYEGPALQDGTMSVDDLAPALLGIAKLFNEANKTVNKDQTKTAVYVKGTEAGSFIAYLDVLVNPLKDVLKFLGSQEITGAVNLKEVVIGVATLILFLGGYRVYNTRKIEKNRVRITIDEKSGYLDIPAESLDLSKSVPIVESFLKVFTPVKNDGIDVARISDGADTVVSVTENDLKYFQSKTSEVAAEETINRYIMNLSIITLTFRKDNKWRVFNGAAEFYVSMEDEAFLSKVEENAKAFRRDDILKCVVEQTQKIQDGKLTAEHRIVEVTDHISGEGQQDLE